jgi:hypothetical protein
MTRRNAVVSKSWVSAESYSIPGLLRLIEPRSGGFADRQATGGETGERIKQTRW